MGHGIEERDTMVSYTVGDLTVEQATPWHASMTGDKTKVIDAVERSAVDAVVAHGYDWQPVKRAASYWAPSGVTPELAGSDWHPMTVDGVTVGVLVVEGVPTMAKVKDGELWTEHKTNDCFAVTNSNTNDHIGRTTVGRVWQGFSNLDTAEFLDALTGDSSAVETMGTLQNERQFWALVRLDREVTIDGEGETIPYLLICNSHDGTGKLRVMAVLIRVVCANTLAMATSGARQSWDCRHTGKLEQRVAEARSSLKLGWQYFDAFEADVAELLATPVTSKQFTMLIDRTDPMPEPKVLQTADDGTPLLLEAASTRAVNAAESRRATLRALWRHETGAGNHGGSQGDAFGALMVYSTADLHGRQGRGDNADETQQRHVIGGGSTKVLTTVRRELAAVLN
jgi:phage/plasmid-like protein (TIGR03299 family)